MPKETNELQVLKDENKRLRSALELAHDWMFNGTSTPYHQEVKKVVKEALGLKD